MAEISAEWRIISKAHYWAKAEEALAKHQAKAGAEQSEATSADLSTEASAKADEADPAPKS